jgi:hypothetical protein
MSVNFLAQGNDDLSLMSFEPMRLVIIRLQVPCVKHWAMLPLIYNEFTTEQSGSIYNLINYNFAVR